MGKWFKAVVQLSIGIVILLWLFQLADLSKVLKTLMSMNPVSLAIPATFFIIASTFVAFALYVIVKSLDSRPPLWKTVMVSFAGQLLSDVTPARSGYFVTPLILNKMCGISIEKGVTSVLFTGITNSFVKVILGVVALAYFLRFLPIQPMIVNAMVIGIIFLLTGGLFLLTLMLSKRFLRVSTVLRRIPLVKVVLKKLMDVLEKTQKEGRRAYRAFPLIFLLIVLSVVANAIALFSISNILWYGSPNLLEFIFIAALAGSLMYVPVTVAGLGVQETGYVILLTLLGMPLERAVAFALIARLLFTGTDIIGIFPLLRVGVRYEDRPPKA